MFIAIVSSGDSWRRSDTIAVNLAAGLVKKGHEVKVYNLSEDVVFESENDDLITYYKLQGRRPGSFIYILSSLWDIRQQNYDLVLQLGDSNIRFPAWLMGDKLKVSDTWHSRFPAYMRWIRLVVSKKCYLKLLFGDHCITNSRASKKNLSDRYAINVEYIPEGAFTVESKVSSVTKNYGLVPGHYNITRYMGEIHTNLDIILKGASKMEHMPFLVIGKFDTRSGNLVKQKYKKYLNIRFVESTLDEKEVKDLLTHANFYFHAYSSSNTYTPLLQAMASDVLISAFKHSMNTDILDRNAFYFKNAEEVAAFIRTVDKNDYRSWISINRSRINEIYNWDKVTDQYESYFRKIAEIPSA